MERRVGSKFYSQVDLSTQPLLNKYHTEQVLSKHRLRYALSDELVRFALPTFCRLKFQTFLPLLTKNLDRKINQVYKDIFLLILF